MRWFLALQTQWRFFLAPMSGQPVFQGIDYAAAVALAPCIGITDIRNELPFLQIMEMEALEVLNKC